MRDYRKELEWLFLALANSGLGSKPIHHDSILTKTSRILSQWQSNDSVSRWQNLRIENERLIFQVVFDFGSGIYEINHPLSDLTPEFASVYQTMNS